jgi:GNAT superfamily N-acetyltransferase
MNIEIKPLSPALEDAFLDFFDHRAFTDNPEWASCYCCYYKVDCTGREWMKRSAQQNRDLARSLIRAGKMNGYLAFAGGDPVGWCHADAWESLLQLKGLPHADGNTMAVVCFIIAPEYRRKGIAACLLDYVCKDCARLGCEIIEAWSGKAANTDAAHCRGPVLLYEKAGFVMAGENKHFYHMVRKLNPAIPERE